MDVRSKIAACEAIHPSVTSAPLALPCRGMATLSMSKQHHAALAKKRRLPLKIEYAVGETVMNLRPHGLAIAAAVAAFVAFGGVQSAGAAC